MLPRTGLSWAKNTLYLFTDRRLGHRGRWILLSMIIGTVSGLGAILFDLIFHLSQTLLIEGIAGFRPPASGIEGGEGFGPRAIWLLPLSLGVGGLISGALVFWLAPEAEGHGTDAVIRSFHHLRGKIRRRVPLIKMVASAVTIGSGGSAGREGPIAQIGAGFGSALADALKLTNHDRRLMMMAGVAGGIGSIFRAPLGASLFAAEVLYSKPEFEYEVLLPGLISAITGYSIYSSYAGFGYLFEVPPISFHEPGQLPTYVVLGVLCAMLGAIYPRIFYGTRDRVFRKIRIPMWLKPALGALALGGIAMLFPEALGMGYGYIQEAIEGSRTIQFMLLFAAVKIVATSLTISSGGSGGVFGPSLVIGGALGAAFGELAQVYVPAFAPEPVACIMVGMGGFFAGVAKTPFAAVIMVMEMTGSYGLLVPSLLVATLAYLLLPLSSRLYEHQLPSRPDSPAHTGSFAVDVLRHLRVGDVLAGQKDPVVTVPLDMPFPELVELASEVRQNVFPVVDADGRALGEVSIEDVRRALVLDVAKRPRTAEDAMRDVVGPLLPDDSLATASRLLATRVSDSVTVVESRTTRRVIGTLSRRELIVAYGHEMERLRDSGDIVREGDPF